MASARLSALTSASRVGGVPVLIDPLNYIYRLAIDLSLSYLQRSGKENLKSSHQDPECSAHTNETIDIDKPLTVDPHQQSLVLYAAASLL